MEDWRKTLDRLLENLKKERTTKAIILYGDYAKGKVRRHSLLRLLILVTEQWQKRQTLELDDIPVELQYYSVDHCRDRVKKERYFALVKAFVEGKIVHGESKTIQDLQNQAKEIYLDGPKRLTQNEINDIRANSFQRYQRIKRSIDHWPETTLLLMNNAFQPCLEAFFKIRRIWLGSRDYMLAEIRKRDSQFYKLCILFLGEPTPQKKFAVLTKIYQYVLEPVGGFLKAPVTNFRWGRSRTVNIVLGPFILLKELYEKIMSGETEGEGRIAYIVRFMHFLKAYKFFFFEVTLFGLLSAILSLPFPFFTKILFDNVLPDRNFAMLEFILWTTLFVSIFRGLISFVQGYYTIYINNLIQYDIRFKFYAHLLKLSYRFYDEEETGQIIFRFQDAMEALRIVSGLILQLLSYIIYIMVIPVVIFIIDWKLALLSAVVLPFNMVAYIKLSQFVRRYTKAITAKRAEYTAKNYETISGMKTIQALTLENYIIHKMKKIYLELRKNIVRLATIVRGVQTGIGAIGALGTFILAWYAWHRILSGSLSLGSFMAYFTLAGILFGPIKGIIALGPDIQRGIVRSQRFFQIYDIKPAIQSRPQAIKVERLQGDLEFKDVSFEYEVGRNILHDINVRIKAGQTVALVGRSGTGKTTFVNLIPRFYEHSSGTITIDGRDIRDLDVKSLRHRIGIVPQEDFLFEGTVSENIRLGNPKATTEPEIIEAAKAANIHDFILTLPEAYDTNIGPGGAQLSAGEKKRITLARALVKNPDMLILDETTSVLDIVSEGFIYQAMKKATKNRTTFVIAHRLSTIKDADYILVFEEGTIVGQGKHEELLQANQAYRELFEKASTV
jgi:ABC-type bacteriocin/lantibiotic exporter with double-glycine peptidase domain